MNRVSELSEVLRQSDFQLTRPFRITLTLALLAITFLATTPLDYSVVPSDFGDKVEHLAAFLMLAFLTDFAFPRSPWNSKKFLLLLGYGLLLEVLQGLIPFRYFSVWDLAADALGLLIYPLILPLLQKLPWLASRWTEQAPPHR